MADWVKLHTDLLDNPDVVRMDPSAFRTYTFLLMLAKAEKQFDGVLLGWTVRNLSWRLRCSEGSMAQDLDTLTAFGFIQRESVDTIQILDLRPFQPELPIERRGWQKARRHVAFQVFAIHGEYCGNCGSQEDLTIDHVKPLSRGGTNDLDNLRVLCRRCNSRKGARMDG